MKTQIGLTGQRVSLSKQARQVDRSVVDSLNRTQIVRIRQETGRLGKTGGWSDHRLDRNGRRWVGLDPVGPTRYE